MACDGTLTDSVCTREPGGPATESCLGSQQLVCRDGWMMLEQLGGGCDDEVCLCR
jgi:hypothetical protein